MVFELIEGCMKHPKTTLAIVAGTVATLVAVAKYEDCVFPDHQRAVYEATLNSPQEFLYSQRDASVISSQEPSSMQFEYNPRLDIQFRKPAISKKLTTIRGLTDELMDKVTMRDVLLDLNADGLDNNDLVYTITRQGEALRGEIIYETPKIRVGDLPIKQKESLEYIYNHLVKASYNYLDL